MRYAKCDTVMTKMVVATMKTVPHAELIEAGVKLDLLFIADGDVDADGVPLFPCLKLRGRMAAAAARILNLRDRAKGLGDAEIIFDQCVWSTLTDEQRVALIDHELTHLEIRRDKLDQVKLDNCGRPQLATREHDFEIGGFHEVIERHGVVALEAEYVTKVVELHKQQIFDWADAA